MRLSPRLASEREIHYALKRVCAFTVMTSTDPLHRSRQACCGPSANAAGKREGFRARQSCNAKSRKGVTRRRVGIQPNGRAPVREGAGLLDEDGAKIGAVTSGGFGPSVGGPVAMGYVETRAAEAGGRSGRSSRQDARSDRRSMPFVEQRYYRR